MKIERVMLTDSELTQLVIEHLKKHSLEVSNPSEWNVLECSDDCKTMVFGVE